MGRLQSERSSNLSLPPELVAIHTPMGSRMRPSGIVKGVDISAYGGPCLRDTGVGPQVHLLVFDGPPQALDEDVVSPGAFPIHADLDLVLEQQAGEGDAGELGALILSLIHI